MKFKIVYFKILAAICILEALFYFSTHHSNYHPDNHINEHNITPEERKLQRALGKAIKEPKTILFWPGESSAEIARLQTYIDDAHSTYSPIQECGNCVFSLNQSKIEAPDTAAVIFLYKFVHPGIMPQKRRTDQLYVYWTNESPNNLKQNHGKTFEFEDYVKFNATMTYRRDSDIYRPYITSIFRTYKMSDLQSNDLTEILPSKNLWAAAVVTNCKDSPSSIFRLNFIQQMMIESKGRLQTFGSCFGKVIPRTKNSIADFVKPYKFFLAFENSYHCRDYITEKFFQNALHGNAIPVVWGATKEDYLEVAPPGSFIFVEDFVSTKALIDYLDYLDKNDTAYLEYFRWRTMKIEEFPIFKRKHDLCQLCRIVHGINIDDIYNPNYNPESASRPLFDKSMSPRKVESLKIWFYTKENKDCFKSSFKMVNIKNG
uniref:4-galactosyl-N-acetylglucosaminide 3-alpha-L-fucosyltransferase 9-like n=1 Tax=Styela clava TaxID=7725 RepID=UPI001939D57F|nr:4-galactosyl-N-acetylglucosaminide 3-alpha-L-fucosyltransferase 9-like [Styela clava]